MDIFYIFIHNNIYIISFYYIFIEIVNILQIYKKYLCMNVSPLSGQVWLFLGVQIVVFFITIFIKN